MFNLDIKTGDKKIVYKSYSISIKYLIDDGNLEESLSNMETVFDCKFSELQKKNFLSKKDNSIRISKSDGKPDAVIIYKIKLDDKFDSDLFRNHLSGLIKQLPNEQLKHLHIFIPDFKPLKSHFSDEEYFMQTFVEGIMLGNYSFDKYKSDKDEKRDLNVFFYSENVKTLKSAVKKGLDVMSGVYYARDLQNEPALNLTPAIFGKRLLKDFPDEKIKVTVWDEKEIKKRKMGGLLAVGMGSSNKPRFIILHYKPSQKSSKKSKLKKIALVGKGVTFDSGGISLKPANNMGLMKADMSGAAVVAGTLLAASRSKLQVELIGVIPAAENMLSGDSMRPGDVVKTSSGKTIEVDNTDAEGRMILADGLDYASGLKPDLIIDLATLTGAVAVALGDFVAGLFSKNNELADKLYQSGQDTYDRVWRLPLWDDYHKLNKSEIADVKNVGGRWGGAITAAKFLENFVDKNIKWAHLDIAGPSIPHDMKNYTKKYMTGFGVRLLYNFLQQK